MLKLENHLGVIEISEEYFANLIGHAVSECFGVAGMVSSGAVQGLRSALTKEEFTDKGVSVKAVNGSLVVDLHIAVISGLNIATTERSIVGKVRYVTEKATGLQVAKVNVFVDEMI